MKILLTSVGTRGDMEPFLAIGELLKKKGHQVICAFPEQFRGLAEQTGLEFASLGEKFIALLESETGKAAMGGSTGFKKVRAILKLARTQKESQKELFRNQMEIIESSQPDRVLYNGKAIYPIIWEIKNPGKSIFVSPLPYMHYVKRNTHIAFNSNWGTFFNRLSFSLAHFGIITTVRMSKKWMNIQDHTPNRRIKEILQSGRSIYTISPALFPRPEEWHDNLKVLGYHERDQKSNWQPDTALEAFLAKHPKPLFFTFGSMTNPEPEKKTEIILNVLIKHQIPAIINTASGGLVQPENFSSDLIHFISQVPYDWLFPKVYGVIHHGGSGTTHTALKHGCVSLIIPHIIDQFAWNRILSNLGVGPKGMKIGKVSTRKLESAILDLYTNPDYQEKAREVKAQMEAEHFKGELYSTITR